MLKSGQTFTRTIPANKAYSTSVDEHETLMVIEYKEKSVFKFGGNQYKVSVTSDVNPPLDQWMTEKEIEDWTNLIGEVI